MGSHWWHPLEGFILSPVPHAQTGTLLLECYGMNSYYCQMFPLPRCSVSFQAASTAMAADLLALAVKLLKVGAQINLYSFEFSLRYFVKMIEN